MEKISIKCKICKYINSIPLEKIKNLNVIECKNCKSIINIPVKPIEVGFGNFHEEVIENYGVTLVEFWSESSLYCKKMNRILEDFAEENIGRLKVAMVNIDKEAILSRQFGIQIVPTLLLFNNGKIVSELTGALPKEELKNWLSYYFSLEKK